jgi:hypothetical protein
MGYLFVEAEGAPTRPQRRILKGGGVFLPGTEIWFVVNLGDNGRPNDWQRLILESESHPHTGEGVNLVFLKDFQEVP